MDERVSDKEARHMEAADNQINTFIERRSRRFGSEEAYEHERALRAAERARRRDQQDLRCELWRRRYVRLAVVHEHLAQQNRERAERLAENGGGAWG